MTKRKFVRNFGRCFSSESRKFFWKMQIFIRTKGNLGICPARASKNLVGPGHPMTAARHCCPPSLLILSVFSDHYSSLSYPVALAFANVLIPLDFLMQMTTFTSPEFFIDFFCTPNH